MLFEFISQAFYRSFDFRLEQQRTTTVAFRKLPAQIEVLLQSGSEFHCLSLYRIVRFRYFRSVLVDVRHFLFLLDWRRTTYLRYFTYWPELRFAAPGWNRIPQAGHTISSEPTRLISDGSIRRPQFGQTVFSDARTFARSTFLRGGTRRFSHAV
jgi:hypothetical protein